MCARSRFESNGTERLWWLIELRSCCSAFGVCVIVFWVESVRLVCFLLLLAKTASEMQRHRTKPGEVSEEKAKEPSDNGTSKSDGWLDWLIERDIQLTERFAVCAARKSNLGHIRPFLKILEISCHGVPWLVGAIVAVLLSHRPWLHEVLMNLFVALLFDLLAVFIFKVTIRRRRPEYNMMDMFATISADKFSFPSGHATRAAMVTCYMFALLPLSLAQSVIVIVWATLVIISRVMLGRHYVSDIISGVIIGVIQYYVFINYFWLSSETCENIIRPIQEEVHL